MAGEGKEGEEEDGAKRSSGESPLCPPVLVKVLGTIPLLLALLFYLSPRIISEWEAYFGYGTAPTYNVPASVLHHFRRFDEDGNGFLDPYEFQRFMEQHQPVWRSSNDSYLGDDFGDFTFEDFYMGDGDEVLVVRADMKPIVLKSMTKFDDDEQLYIGSPETLLPGLVKWREPHEMLHAYGALNFRTFLPPTSDWPLGTAYFIVDQHVHESEIHMNRYRPVHPPPKHALLHSLLAQLHPNVFLVTRFGPRGTVAVVRARNEDMVDIAIRVHAEFQLNHESNYPFWFTPAQFAGRLVINTTSSHVEHFELNLPTDKQLNVDMEWMTGAETNEVDIGFVPLMKVVSTQPSFLSQVGMEKPVEDIPFEDSHIHWDHQISMDEARVILERTFYPFKKVTYFPFLTAFQKAFTEHKLVHLVLLWGSLDDQSC